MSPEDSISYNVCDEIVSPDMDKMFVNEHAWRKSGRLEQKGRVAGWMREMQMALDE
jgi:hypothetical protein